MRLTQGAFSFLPDLTDDEIRLQVEYCLEHGWAVSVEYTDDPHPRNTYWEMWGRPMFDLRDAAGVMGEITACREAAPEHYMRVNAFDSTQGRRVRRAVVHREPARRGARLLRVAGPKDRAHDRLLRSHSYAVDRAPEGARYGRLAPARPWSGRMDRTTQTAPG